MNEIEHIIREEIDIAVQEIKNYFQLFFKLILKLQAPDPAGIPIEFVKHNPYQVKEILV